jgi:tripartite-type tricarboxylate transporter receptor subunit TctC
VPTVKELGYDIEYYIWTGLFAPKAAPANVVQILRAATRRAVQDDEFKAFWDSDARRIAAVIQHIAKAGAK